MIIFDEMIFIISYEISGTMASRSFNIEIRDELKKMSEFEFIRIFLHKIDASNMDGDEVNLVKKISIDSIIDCIVICSKNDTHIAKTYLKKSKEFVSNCIFFLYPSFPNNFSKRCYLTKNLLMQIWSLGFIVNQCIEFHDLKEAKTERSSFDLLQDVLVIMNEDRLLQIADDIPASGSRRISIILKKINEIKMKKFEYDAKFKNLQRN